MKTTGSKGEFFTLDRQKEMATAEARDNAEILRRMNATIEAFRFLSSMMSPLESLGLRQDLKAKLTETEEVLSRHKNQMMEQTDKEGG